MSEAAIKYADRILHEFRRGKKAASVSPGDFMECLIICTDGSVEKITGHWACEILARTMKEK